MKIGLDVMGGDFAPKTTIEGAINALQFIPKEDTIVLIGDKSIIENELKNAGGDIQSFEIIHTTDVIDMGEKPIKAFTQKTNSSIAVGFKMLKEGLLDAFSSAGNSGAMLVGSMYSVSTIPGVMRPCTCTVLPKEDGGVSVLVDIGTNPDSKPEVMYQFAILGSLYAKYVYHIENPRIGLLNIGEEEEKGNLQCQAAFHLMKDSKDFDFHGNVEIRDLFKNKVDVFVCDGFIGNMVIKLIETMYRQIYKRNLLDGYFKRMNYELYGGSAILGVNAPVVIGHGISSGLAIQNMLLLSREVAATNLTERIREAMVAYSQGNLQNESECQN